jgi:hypothetical protein
VTATPQKEQYILFQPPKHYYDIDAGKFNGDFPAIGQRRVFELTREADPAGFADQPNNP